MSSVPLVCVEDYKKSAFSGILPKAVLGYYKSGATQEITLKENEEAFQRWYIRPRMLRDVVERSLATTVLGHKVLVPFGVAPTAMQKMAHPLGEIASAKGAGRIGCPFTLSTIATSSIEEVAQNANDTLKFFQLYIYKDRSVTASLVHRAEKSGYKALVLTVDAPSFGIRWDDIRNRFTLPSHLRMANFDSLDKKSSLVNESKGGSGISEYVNSLFDPSLTWKDVKWLNSITSLPIVLKGILTGEDAILGMKSGASAIWVSNHGARQIDGVPPTMLALEEVLKAVNGGCEVYVDGGFSQGTHVYKALALGANMVFIGRPILWGLTCEGEKGVFRVLDIIQKELDNTMQLTGCPTIPSIDRSCIIKREQMASL